jgi:Holliday junction resolvase RusA-like endonuclease
MIPYFVADEDAAVEVLATDGSLHQIRFEISGDPRPLERPRFARMLHRIGRSYPLMYNPSRRIIRNFKAAAREVLLIQPGETTAFSNQDYLEVDCWFVFSRPPSHFNNDGSLREDAPRFPLVSDVDNMGKLVLDALEGILYPNDKRIIDLRLIKSYPPAEYPRDFGRTLIKACVV